MQQVKSRQGDLDAAIKEQHAKLTGGADEAPCTLADCLAQHNELHVRINEHIAWCAEKFDEIDEPRLGDLEREIYTAAELAAWPVERPKVHERLAKLDSQMPELEELRQVQRVHTEQVQALDRAHAEQCAQLRAEHAAQMKQSEAEMQALKASCEEQASTGAALLQTLEELRKLHSVHTQQMQALEIAHAEQLQQFEQRVTEPRGLEQQHQTALEQLGKQVRDLEQQQQADAKKVKALEQQQFAFETEQMAALQRLLEAERLRRHSESLAEDQRHHEQMAALRNQRLRGNEKLLSSKELAFADPPRFSHGSFTTPPASSGGRGGQLTRPSAPWTHSSRTRDFDYEQEKMQGNDRRLSPGSTYSASSRSTS